MMSPRRGSAHDSSPLRVLDQCSIDSNRRSRGEVPAMWREPAGVLSGLRALTPSSERGCIGMGLSGYVQGAVIVVAGSPALCFLRGGAGPVFVEVFSWH